MFVSASPESAQNQLRDLTHLRYLELCTDQGEQRQTQQTRGRHLKQQAPQPLGPGHDGYQDSRASRCQHTGDGQPQQVHPPAPQGQS